MGSEENPRVALSAPFNLGVHNDQKRRQEYLDSLDLDRARREGQLEATSRLEHARRAAEAKAMILLAARECPADLIEWGKMHDIPLFAEMTWQAGFAAGMRMAMLEKTEE